MVTQPESVNESLKKEKRNKRKRWGKTGLYVVRWQSKRNFRKSEEEESCKIGEAILSLEGTCITALKHGRALDKGRQTKSCTDKKERKTPIHKVGF